MISGIQASLLLKQNVHPKIESERLGHSSVGITLDRYSHTYGQGLYTVMVGFPGPLFVCTGHYEVYERAFGAPRLVSIFKNHVLTPC